MVVFGGTDMNEGGEGVDLMVRTNQNWYVPNTNFFYFPIPPFNSCDPLKVSVTLLVCFLPELMGALIRSF